MLLFLLLLLLFKTYHYLLCLSRWKYDHYHHCSCSLLCADFSPDIDINYIHINLLVSLPINTHSIFLYGFYIALIFIYSLNCRKKSHNLNLTTTDRPNTIEVVPVKYEEPPYKEKFEQQESSTSSKSTNSVEDVKVYLSIFFRSTVEIATNHGRSISRPREENAQRP